MPKPAMIYDKRTASFLAYLVQQMPADLDGETMREWTKVKGALKENLEGLKYGPRPDTRLQLFSLSGTCDIGPLGSKKTSECCAEPLFNYRDERLDTWLPAEQPETPGRRVYVLSPKHCRHFSFGYYASRVVSEWHLVNPEDIDRELKRGDHLLTFAQAEQIVDAAERGEETGLWANRLAKNLFFTEDRLGNVVLGSIVGTRGSGWCGSVCKLDFSVLHGRSRLLVPNFDLSKLELGRYEDLS